MDDHSYFREIKKHCALKKKPLSATKHSNLQETKIVFLGTTIFDHSFF